MTLDKETFNIFLSSIEKFVKNKLIPKEEEVVNSNEIPQEIVLEMKKLGIFGLSIPEEYGGSNLTMEEEVKVAFELGKASPAFRSIAGTNIGIGSQTIVMAGTKKQKEKYLPKFATGEFIGSFALTEPDAGSDAMSIQTKAKKVGNKYIINGTKRYITNAPIANVFSVMARTKPEKLSSSISCFLVDANLNGITIGKPDTIPVSTGISDPCRYIGFKVPRLRKCSSSIASESVLTRAIGTLAASSSAMASVQFKRANRD